MKLNSSQGLSGSPSRTHSLNERFGGFVSSSSSFCCSEPRHAHWATQHQCSPEVQLLPDYHVEAACADGRTVMHWE